MEVSIDENDLRTLLTSAYEKGWRGSLDLKDEIIDQLVKSYLEDNPSKPKVATSWSTTSWDTIDGTTGSISIMVDGTNIDPADRSTWDFNTGG